MSKRVLHVSAVDFTTSKLLAPQLRELQARGYDVRVATGRTDEQFWSELTDLHPVDIQFPRSLSPTKMAASTKRLVSLAQEWRPEILHLHTPAASIPVRMIPRWAWPAETKIFYTVHGYLHMWPPSGRRGRLVQFLEQRLSHRTDTTLFQSHEDFEQAQARGYGSSLHFLGNGVEDEWFSVPKPARKPRGKLSLIFVGRLVREKGVLDLLDAVRSADGVSLHLVGDALPSDRDSVADEVARRVSHNSDLQQRVHLYGMLSRAEILRVYAKADAVVLPSYREGVPRSLIEGLAASRPAIATRIRGCSELVRTGSNGELVEPGDVAGLVRAIESLRDLTEDEFDLFSDEARALVDPAFRETRVFERLIQAYESDNQQ